MVEIERAERYVGYMAYSHFGVSEVPIGVLIELDQGVPVIVLGTQADEDGETYTQALVQVTFDGKPAAIYVPWDKIALQGKREFNLVDATGPNGLPFPTVR